MGSAKIEVTVVTGGRRVDGPLQRPIRLTPEGVAGVVYGGLVYPVRAGNIVDLDDASFDKYDCDSFLDADEPIPYAAGGSTELDRPVYVERWHIERNKFGNYLVLDGSESVAETVVDLLEDAGFEIVRWDASHRPADDGYFYDWFIRFRYSGSFDEARDQIEDVLDGPTRGNALVAPNRDALAETQQKLDSARAANLVLRQQLADAEARERSVSARLEADRGSTAQLTEVAQSLQRHVHELRAKNADLATELVRERRGKTVSVDNASELDELRRANEVLRRDADSSESAFFDAQHEVYELQAKCTALSAELAAATEAKERLADERAETEQESEERARRTRATGYGKSRQTIDAFLARLFRRLSLDRTGVDALLALPKPLTMIKALLALEENEQGLPCKIIKVSAGNRIVEVTKHLHTGENGNSGMGRLYYARRDDGTIAVLVHRKHDGKEQDRTLQAFAGRIDDLDPALDSQDRQAG